MRETVLLAVVALLIAALFMAVFALIRRRRDREAGFWRRRLPPEEQRGITLLDKLPRKQAPRRWPDRIDQAFDRLIQRTGLGWTTEQALAWVALAGVLAAAVLLVWRFELWLAGLGLIVGMLIPLVVYRILQARWRRQLQNQLPDILFLLARSLRAGLSVEQALENVAQHGHRPLADEFRRGVEQIKLGLTVPAALQTMAQRLNLPDFDVFVTIVTLHRNLGGNLTMLLDKVAATTRDRNLFRGQFQAATALSRITGFCLAAGAPMLFLLYALWQPEFVSAFAATLLGVRMLIVAIVLEVIGIAWISYLLRHRY